MSHQPSTATGTVTEDGAALLMESVRDCIKTRIRSDDGFAQALLSEAIQVLLAGDLAPARSALFDYIDATIGFEELALQSGLAADGLRDMFGHVGDPRAADLFRVIGLLQQHQGIRLEVSTAA